jgi:hypothetical protein
MFAKGRLRRRRTRASGDFSNMKAALAQLSPIVPAVLAAAIGISLTVFLLPAAGLQIGPRPLLSVFGGTGRMAADLPPPAANRRAPEQVERASSAAQLAPPRTDSLPRREQAATRAHRVHRPARTRIVRTSPTTRVPTRAPAAPAAPATTRQPFSISRKAKGHGRGHAHGHAPSQPAGAPTHRAHGHGKALGHSNGHQRPRAHGHSKKTPAGTPPAPAPPKGNGGGKGPKGGKK